ncbi:putative disease resistance protein RGA3 [Pistacia vera]|uniref:putative disease resistance protein RGA3 n=1 Tax=Pistacia vera TaxID=55513 RepID=UPI0012631CDD|nr:putative disease resistance protein RGA3 [Pistacia vera]
MWVCVSNDFSMKVIVEQIIKSETSKEPENLGIDKLQEKLRQEINGKKYLLVLDDVWNENPNSWNELKDLLKNGAKGSMILVTTRSEQVAKITSKDRRYHLQGLPKDKSWSLFKQIAFEQGEEPKSSTLIAIGKEILAKCAGVPLAIKTIGRLLYDNYAVDDWLHFRDSELSKIDQEETDVLPIFKLSYDYLPSYLKQCFAYCALFPKDYSFEKEKVIYLWMAQGFVQKSNENQSPEDLGNKYFMELLSRSFFQVAPQYRAIFMYNTHYLGRSPRKTMYKMHDLMHDLAQLVIGSEGIIATSCTKYINERCRHVSLGFHLQPSQKFPEELLKAKHIRTLLFPFKPLKSPGYIRPNLSCRNIFFIYCLCWYDSENFRDEITLTYAGSKFWCLRILDFSCLRMLDLSCLYLQKLPSSIGRLKYLRYLDLSCNEIKKLPNSILKLINLEILDLSYCYRLKKLPKDMRKMVSLRYLIIEECTSLYKGNGGLPTELEPLTKPRKTSPL